MSQTQYIKNIPNYLTLLRIVIIPIIVITFYFDDKVFAHQLSAILFACASITDFLDGYLARKYGWKSKIGMMLDPVADKLLITSILLMLVKFSKSQEIPCLLILTREIAVMGMREFLSQSQMSIPVTKLSKIKTTMQMVSLFVLLLGTKGSHIMYFDNIGNCLLWISALLTLVTGYSYVRTYIQYCFE